MLSKDYRPLLPAPEKPETRSTTSDSTSSIFDSSDHDPAKRKRAGVTVACNFCRSKKTRCDGARPICAVCKKRGVAKCIYNDKREVSEDTVELIDLLRVSTESAAAQALKLLRTTGDPAVVLALLRKEGRDERAPLVDGAWSDSLMLDRSPLEAELMMKNAVSYPVLRKISQSDLEHSGLLLPIHDVIASHLQPLGITTRSRTLSDAEIDTDSALLRFRNTTKSKRSSPGQEARLCDDRLKDLDVSFWTNIKIPNTLAAKIISLYLETDHPLLGTFDPNDFIRDLVGHNRAMCSAFLVNTLLYWGSQAYSAIHKAANEYQQPLCEEAERLWSTEKHTDSVVTMIGAQMLSLAYMGNGKDHNVFVYLAESIKMGMRLCLFGVDITTANEKLKNVPESEVHACSYAAWGVFNWSMQIVLFYRHEGMIYLKSPPSLPIPGDSGREGSAGSSLASFGYLPTRRVLPPYMGNTFPLICEFWAIMREFSLAYFSKQNDPEAGISLDFAEMKYRELLAWAETIPLPIVREEQRAHHVLVLHMWIHSAVLDIFRPFVEKEKTWPLRLKTFSAAHSTPTTAYRASVNQLKQLIFDYRASYEASTYTILWQTALSYVATAVRQDTTDPTWRSWLLLCIYGYETLRRPFRISEAIGQGILTMALRDTDLESDDARKLMNDVKERGLRPLPGSVRATFMGDLALSASNPDGARMETLAQEFDDMAFFRDYTNPVNDTEMS